MYLIVVHSITLSEYAEILNISRSLQMRIRMLTYNLMMVISENDLLLASIYKETALSTVDGSNLYYETDFMHVMRRVLLELL
jgi:hypothetical protein